MAVVIETTLGDITVDLFLKQRPVTCLNFLKLCKMKYYNFNLFHSIRSGFIAQTGDPTGEGSGGESIWGILEGPKKRFFSGEKMPRIRHTDAGLLSMVCTEDMMIGSQFFFTLATDLDSLDGQHCVIGQVTEGHDVLRKLNEVICDESHRPYRDVRITHTVILEDPFNDPAGLRAPSRSPSPNAERLRGGRIAPDEEIDETLGKSIAEVQEIIDEKEAKARATILEIIGDLPDADIAPPENVLFVCKLNPVTTDEDLEIIFSRFGTIVSCEVIRDKKTGDSLQYAFIEFSDKKSCEDAYFKMDNVLIDDRRIHVDFSQSVSKMKWLGKGRGVKHFTDEEIRQQNNNAEKTRAHSRDKDPSSRRDRYSNKEKQDDRRRNNEKEQPNNRENRHSDRDRDRERRNRNETDADKKYRSRTDTSKDNRESRRDKNVENGRHPGKSNDVSENRNKVNEDSKIPPKDGKSKRSPERNKRNNEHRSDRHRESENTKKDEHRRSRERRRHEERKDSEKNEQINSHADREMHRDQKHEKHHRPKDDDISFAAPDKQRQRSHHRRSSITEEKEKIYSIHESKKENRNKSTEKKYIEPKTPSPSPIKKIKDKTNKKKTIKKSVKVKDSAAKKKKKRKRSSSSSSESDSDSSSSSSSSSSDESDKKKKSKRKRKYSTSSTSSSSSDSSSTTTSSSSDSSSDSEPRKKRSKKNSKKKLGGKKK